MGSTYTPTYYTSLHESITSLCKTILPFSFKKRRVPAIAAAEQRLSKHQSDNLKWQQESYHQMLKLMGLCKEGILDQNEVSAFRSHLIETITAVSLVDYEPPVILRDKLIFLQDLFYANCITEDEYHASKRLLLERLAVQGATIRESDVIIGAHNDISNEEWSVIYLKEKKQRLVDSEKESSTIKYIKGYSSDSDFVSPDKAVKSKEDTNATDSGNISGIRARDRNISTTRCTGNELMCSTENPFWNRCLDESETESKSILRMKSLQEAPVVAAKQSGSEKGKKKPLRALFRRNQKEEEEEVHSGASNDEDKEKLKLVKRTWGFDGFKKWIKTESEDEMAPLSSLSEKSDDASYNGRIEEGPITKQIKKRLLHPSGSQSSFFVDEDSGENIKKELSRTKTEFSKRSPRRQLSDDQIEEVSVRHPVDNADLKKFFPGSWCDRHDDDVDRQGLKDHVQEIGNSKATAKEKQDSKRWTTFDDDEENTHPNLFAPRGQFYSSGSSDRGFGYNPFSQSYA